MLIQVVFPGEEDASRTQKEASSFEGYPPRRSPSSLFEAKTVQTQKGRGCIHSDNAEAAPIFAYVKQRYYL